MIPLNLQKQSSNENLTLTLTLTILVKDPADRFFGPSPLLRAILQAQSYPSRTPTTDSNPSNPH